VITSGPMQGFIPNKGSPKVEGDGKNPADDRELRGGVKPQLQETNKNPMLLLIVRDSRNCDLGNAWGESRGYTKRMRDMSLE